MHGHFPRTHIVKNHSLIVSAQTTPTQFDEFLRSVYQERKSHGNLHLRAYETTYSPPGGQPCTVKVLFVRSGRESLFEWFKNNRDREAQYALAAQVLSDVGGFDTAVSRITAPRYRVYTESGEEKKAEQGVPLSALMEFVPPRTKLPPVPTTPVNPGHLQMRPPSQVPDQATRGFSITRFFSKLFAGSRS